MKVWLLFSLLLWIGCFVCYKQQEIIIDLKNAAQEINLKLKEDPNELPKYIFISRVIINQEYIKEIQKYFNGKYIVLLQDKFQTKVTSGLSYAGKVRNLLEL